MAQVIACHVTDLLCTEFCQILQLYLLSHGAKNLQIVFDLLSVHTLISVHPLLISRIHIYCNLTSVEQLKCRHLVFWFYSSHHDTTSVIVYRNKFMCTLIRTDSLKFFHGPIFYQAYCTLIKSNTVHMIIPSLSCPHAASQPPEM